MAENTNEGGTTASENKAAPKAVAPKKAAPKKKIDPKKATASRSKKVSYRAATEADFKFNEPYMIREGDTFVKYTPKGSLAVQAGKYAGQVARGLAVVKK